MFSPDYELDKHQRYDYQTSARTHNLFSSRALLARVVIGFSYCETEDEKRDYISKLMDNKDIEKSLEIFSWFHYPQQRVFYDKIFDEIMEIKEYRKSLKDDSSYRNNGNK